MPHSAIRTRRIVLVEAEPDRMGGIGSQRRLRRRQPDPRRRERKVALAQRDRHPRGDGHGESRRDAGRYRRSWGSTSTGNAPACCRWRRSRIRSTGCEEAADDGEGQFARRRTRCAPRLHSPTYLAGLFSPDTMAIVHPAKLAFELARACADAGVHIFEHTNATRMDCRRRGAARDTGGGGAVTARQAVLATNVFPSLLRRNRLHTDAGVRLRAGHRAAHRRAAGPHRLARTDRESATAPTSFTTTG